MDAKQSWNSTWKWVAGALVIVYMAWRTYSGDGWVFPFSYADLGFHELGHMLTMFWAPQPLVSFAGSATQVLVPLGLGAYFWFARKELFAVALMFAWAGSSLNNVSVYIYDATRQVLPLLGPQEGHDWVYLLGPGVFNALEHTDTIAYVTRTFSVLLFVAAAGVITYGFMAPRLARREASQLEARQATLPVREPRTWPVGPAAAAPAEDATPLEASLPAE